MKNTISCIGALLLTLARLTYAGSPTQDGIAFIPTSPTQIPGYPLPNIRVEQGLKQPISPNIEIKRGSIVNEKGLNKPAYSQAELVAVTGFIPNTLTKAASPIKSPPLPTKGPASGNIPNSAVAKTGQK